MIRFKVTCKYAPAKFRGKALVPLTDNLTVYTTHLCVASEKAIFPNLLKEIQRKTNCQIIKLYDIKSEITI